jgi:hypothetical protein
MKVAGATFGIVGALAAFPRRLAAREVQSRGGRLRRGVKRKTDVVVFGRRLLEKHDETEIEARVDTLADAGTTPISENGFLRALGILTAPEHSDLTRRSLIDQSVLTSRDFDMLSLFDAFEHDREPYSFRDLILSKKYAGLIAGGANWGAILRSIHRSGPVASLTRMSLHWDSPASVRAKIGADKTELDGQHLLPLPDAEEEDIEEIFSEAEVAEGMKRYDDAAALYARYLALDPGDSVAAYNRANCLRDAGNPDEAGHAYAQAIKLDGGFVEAWFNYAGLLKDRGQPDAARKHLAQAITLDPDYADAVYNLAAIEYDASNWPEARRWWARYLELDETSSWAKKARRGIHYIDMLLNTKKSAG